MIVDVARSCHITRFVFFESRRPRTRAALPNVPVRRAAIAWFGSTPRQTRVRWYFAPEGAKPLPFGTIWASTIWLDVREVCDTRIGEQRRTRKDVWNNGASPVGATGQHFCGRQEDFQAAKTWNPQAPFLPRGPSGLPICCNPILRGCIVWCGRRISQGSLVLAEGDVVVDGSLTLDSPDLAASGSLALHTPHSDVSGVGVAGELSAGGAMIVADSDANESAALALSSVVLEQSCVHLAGDLVSGGGVVLVGQTVPPPATGGLTLHSHDVPSEGLGVDADLLTTGEAISLVAIIPGLGGIGLSADLVGDGSGVLGGETTDAESAAALTDDRPAEGGVASTGDATDEGLGLVGEP